MKQKYQTFFMILRNIDERFVTEFRFSERRWRFDFALPQLKLAIEVEGGVYTSGRHTRAIGYINDIEKYNKAIELGWTLLRYTPQQLNKTETIKQISNVVNRLKSAKNE